MAGAPDRLTLKEHRDGANRIERVARWVMVTVLAALALAALLNVFGQEPVTTTATGGEATLEVAAPTRLRGGLFYQSRFAVTAGGSDIDKATIVLDKGWTESMHINTIEPAPVGESSRDGRLALDMGHVPAGDTIVLYMQFQVNPTNIGNRSQDVALFDDTDPLAAVDRTVTVFP